MYVVWGLPVAELLTTRVETATVVYALELLKSVLPPGAFYGRGGVTGPQLFMTGNSDCLRNSLSSAWPSADLLLCIFYVLCYKHSGTSCGMENTLWRKKTNPVLLNKCKQVVYTGRETELSDKLEELYADPVCIKYLKYQKHLIVDPFPKIHDWSLSHRISNNLPTSNNTVETSFRYTKEYQFSRHKAYKYVVGTESPQKAFGIDTFLFPCIIVPAP